MQHIYGTTLSSPRNNRWIEQGLSLVRDRGPAAQLKMKWAGPLFLCERTPIHTPTLPWENFCWTSRPLPLPPIRPSIHLHPSYSNSNSLPLLLLWVVVVVQRSFCHGGLSNPPPSRSLLSIPGFSSLSTRPPAQVDHIKERPFPGETVEWRERE